MEQDSTPRQGVTTPFPIADLRNTPLDRLAEDADGNVKVLLDRVLLRSEDPSVVHVATFGSAI